MKDAKHRRKSKNQIPIKPTEINETNQRVIGLPYEQPGSRTKKDRALVKSNVIGVKTMATSDHIKTSKRFQKEGKESTVENIQTVNKSRMPRFSSEQGKERYLAPNLWHKIDEKTIKHGGHGGESKVQVYTLKGSKKAKMFDNTVHRIDSQTPHLERNISNEKQFGLGDEENNPTGTASKVILAQSGKMKRFKRQRISSAESQGQQTYNGLQETNGGPYSVQIIDQGLHQQYHKRQLHAVNVIEATAITESPTQEQGRQQQLFGLKKPSSKNQPSISVAQQMAHPPDSSEMLQLLTNTTIHLQSEADRLAKNGTNSMGVSRKSRDSNKYLKKTTNHTTVTKGGAISSHRSQYTNNKNETDFVAIADGDQQLQIETPMVMMHNNNKLHHSSKQSELCRESGGGGTQQQFRQKYPQTRLKTDQPLQKSAQRKTQLDYKNNSGSSNFHQHQHNGQASTTEKSNPGAGYNNNRRTTQRQDGLTTQSTTTKSIKRKPVSVLEDDYERLFPAPSSSKGEVSISKNQKVSNGFESVGMSLNSIKVERTQRIQPHQQQNSGSGGDPQNQSATDYYPKKVKEAAIEQSARVTMPHIAQTPHVTISSKYSQQSNISRLSTKQVKLSGQSSATTKLGKSKQTSSSHAANHSNLKVVTLHSQDKPHADMGPLIKGRQPSAKVRGEKKNVTNMTKNMEMSTLKDSSSVMMHNKHELSSQPHSSQFTIQSPPSSHHNQDRRPLFDHGRTSRTKNVKNSYYPALNQGVSTTSVIKLPDTTQQNNLVHSSDCPNNIASSHPQQKEQSSQSKHQHTGMPLLNQQTATDSHLTQQAALKLSTAPKFIPAGSIKMQQAVKASQNKPAHLLSVNNNVAHHPESGASIRNLHDHQGGNMSNQQNRRLPYPHPEFSNPNLAGQQPPYNVGGQQQRRHGNPQFNNQQQNGNNQQQSSQLGQFNHRGAMSSYTYGPNGKPTLNRPKHVLESSSSADSADSDSDDQPDEEAINQDETSGFVRNKRKIESEKEETDNTPHHTEDTIADVQQSSPEQVDSFLSPSPLVGYNQFGYYKTVIACSKKQPTSQGLPPITSNQTAVAVMATTTTEKKKRKKTNKGAKLVFNLMYTVYPLVKKVAKQLNFRTRTEDIQLMAPQANTEEYFIRQSGYMQNQLPDFDVSWIDNGIHPEVLKQIKSYQRISQFPGISVISNKKKLASGLMRMYKRFPEQYEFFPQTYLLPVEQNEFKLQFEKYSRKAKAAQLKEAVEAGEDASLATSATATFIIKPENLCQGKGIYLVKDPNDVDHTDHCVAQLYITNPFLIDDLKFDLRLYVLLTGVSPLRALLFKDGLVRLATEPYVKPTEDNIGNLFMHLTNYAINKKNNNFQQNGAEDSDGDMQDDGTHKRSLKSLIYTLKCMGKPYRQLKEGIDDLLVKTLIVAQPSLSHMYKSCQPDDLENQLCFQILGVDVMVDENCKPWLIEVNQSPSFKADSGLDKRIKEKLVADTVNLLNLSTKRKQKWIQSNKKVIQQRMITGKKIKLTPEEREEIIQGHTREREDYEKNNLGKFRMIYPCEGAEKMANYEELIQASQESWEDFAYGKRRRFQGLPTNTVQNNKNESTKDVAALAAAEAVEKPIWRNGQIINYVPAWERKFQKSLQQKQARMNSLQQQSTQDNNKAAAMLSARQQQNVDLPSARGVQNNPFRQSHTIKSSTNNKEQCINQQD